MKLNTANNKLFLKQVQGFCMKNAFANPHRSNKVALNWNMQRLENVPWLPRKPLNFIKVEHTPNKTQYIEHWCVFKRIQSPLPIWLIVVPCDSLSCIYVRWFLKGITSKRFLQISAVPQRNSPCVLERHHGVWLKDFLFLLRSLISPLLLPSMPLYVILLPLSRSLLSSLLLPPSLGRRRGVSPCSDWFYWQWFSCGGCRRGSWCRAW